VNDDAQVEMLCRNGKTPEVAADYILIGCYEPAVMGRELNCSGAAGLNLAKAVELVLAGSGAPMPSAGACAVSGPPMPPQRLGGLGGPDTTFEDLMEAYLGILDSHITRILDKVRREERLWPRINPSPLLSGTMDSCVERGLDVSQAGAKYNTSGICCYGIANAVDSLAVIRQFVYEERRCTLAELRDILAANWQGHEDLRLIARNRVPKWGNNDDRVDALAVRITDFLGQRINCEPNARGGVFQAALYAILDSAKQWGRPTGALPDGRLAGEPLTLNTGASIGMDRAGVTSLLSSVSGIDLSLFPNGTVLDVMLHPTVTGGSEGVRTLCSLIRSYFARGGMAIQFNIFDAALLREAQRDPARFATLQVRVCGWNARFVDLAPDVQEMFIAKAEAA